MRLPGLRGISASSGTQRTGSARKVRESDKYLTSMLSPFPAPLPAGLTYLLALRRLARLQPRHKSIPGICRRLQLRRLRRLQSALKH